MHEIETPRLRLRMFTPEDLDDLASMLGDPDVMRYMSGGQPIPREDITLARIERRNNYWEEHGFGLWAVEHKADGKMIGQCGFFHLDQTPEVEIAYLYAKPYWGQGLATEAAKAARDYGFDKIGLDRIVGITRHENIPSQRVLEKIGLRFEREAQFYDLDVRYYALNRENAH